MNRFRIVLFSSAVCLWGCSDPGEKYVLVQGGDGQPFPVKLADTEWSYKQGVWFTNTLDRKELEGSNLAKRYDESSVSKFVFSHAHTIESAESIEAYMGSGPIEKWRSEFKNNKEIQE